MDHWNYQHGQETLEAKAANSERLVELRNLEALAFKYGFAAGPRWRGRKPKKFCQVADSPSANGHGISGELLGSRKP